MVSNGGKIGLFVVALCLAFVAFPVTIQAADFNVPVPYPTIQAGLDAAGSGDRVVVAPGTYEENLVMDGDDAGVELVSSDGPASTIIDGTISGSVIVINKVGYGPPWTTVDGFTIRGGYAYRGGGIYILGDAEGSNNGSCAPIIRNCIIGRPSGATYPGNYCDQSGAGVNPFLS